MHVATKPAVYEEAMGEQEGGNIKRDAGNSLKSLKSTVGSGRARKRVVCWVILASLLSSFRGLFHPAVVWCKYAGGHLTARSVRSRSRAHALRGAPASAIFSKLCRVLIFSLVLCFTCHNTHD